MQMIEAALAFAITMLVLSLICSAFVELIHRIFSMREAGLKHMLGQMFDQVLSKYISPSINAAVAVDNTISADTKSKRIGELLKEARKGFVERMSANRAPMGVQPNATPVDSTKDVEKNPSWRFGLWNGRDLSSLSPKDFMERLGSIDLAQAIKKANDEANKLAERAGTLAADAADAVLKDVAQKFEGLGKEAGVYFEGRARLLSVVVATALAFAAHVDAVDLFRTYLRDPNARAKVIEQSEAVTAQYKAAKDAADAVKTLVPDASAAPADVKKELEKLQKDWQAAIGDTNRTVKQYADLGAPLGWTKERIDAADMLQWVWTCPSQPAGGWRTPWGDCNRELRNVWFQVPTVISVWFFLFLGGLLIGLGAPFWYNAVTGLTNIRNVARDITGASAAQALAAQSSTRPIHPVTPAAAFAVSHTANVAAPSGGP